MKLFSLNLTEKQLKALRESASKAGLNTSELVRRALIEKGYIPEDEIEHGGYRERKPKVKKS